MQVCILHRGCRAPDYGLLWRAEPDSSQSRHDGQLFLNRAPHPGYQRPKLTAQVDFSFVHSSISQPQMLFFYPSVATQKDRLMTDWNASPERLLSVSCRSGRSAIMALSSYAHNPYAACCSGEGFLHNDLHACLNLHDESGTRAARHAKSQVVA